MRSILVATVLVIAFSSAGADPIKKDKPPEREKVAKEHVEKFWKAIFDDKLDEAIKLMDLPFMDPEGKIEESHDKFKREFGRGAPKGLEIKVGEVMELKKLNEWIAKNKQKEFTAEKIEAIEKHIGKDSRIVMLDVKMNGEAPPTGTIFMMIKFTDNKPSIVGVGGDR